MKLRRSVSCQQLVELATEYLENELSAPQRRAVDRHLADCADCQNYLEQLRVTIDLLGHLRVSEVPTELLVVLEQALLDEPEPDN